MSDSTALQQVKSFWERKEGKLGAVVLALLIGGGIIILYKVLPFIIILLQNTLHAMILGGAILAIGVLAWDKRFRMLVAMAYKLAMRAVTGWFVTIDPIGILKEHLRKLDGDLEEIDAQNGKVKGVMVGLRRKIDQYLTEYKQYMDLAAAAQKRNMEKEAKSKSMFAQRRKEAAEKLANFHRKLEAIYRVLSKMFENCKIIRDNTGDEIEMKEEEWKAIRAASKAMKSAMSVINGNADERALYEQTLEYMADDLGNKIGEMERFLEVSQGVLAGIDLQNDVYSEKGLKALEDWEKTADSWILGDQKMVLLNAAKDDNNILSIEGPPADVNYSKLFPSLS